MHQVTNENEYKWRRDRERLGVWEGQGKAAAVGFGHSPVDRRWDGVSLDTTLGAYSMIACQKALDDAGLTVDDVDGILCTPSHIAGPAGGSSARWAPRPYFAPPYDSELGLTLVNAAWLIDNMGFKNVTWAPERAPDISLTMGMAAQAIADGRASTVLVVYPAGNLEGRYRRGGENAEPTAKGGRQWSAPWGNHGGNDFINIFPHEQYCSKYGGTHDDLAPYVVNQHRNGHMNHWGYYATHDVPALTTEDYLASRHILNPLRIWDCDLPVNSTTAFLFATAERARELKQKPVYVLNHFQYNFSPRSTQPVLDEIEEWTSWVAKQTLEGAGLKSSEVDIFNPYDGYSMMSQFYLEAFEWHDVKRGDALEFYKGDIRAEGPHPFNTSGGNLGNGRVRSAMYSDAIEQLRGTAGKRQVTVNNETAVCAYTTPPGGGWLVLGTEPRT